MTERPSARSTWMTRPLEDREAWNNFRHAASDVIGYVDTSLQQQLKIGYTDVDALLQLSAAEDCCLRMADLARSVSRSPSALTRLVDRLELRMLVKRARISTTDVRVEVTSKGLDLLAEAAPLIAEDLERRFWSKLTPHERDALSAICQKLLVSEHEGC